MTTEANAKLFVEADSDEIHQLFLNLFKNAEEALSGKPGRLLIQLSEQNSKAVIRFEDSGPGIPEELRAQVFAPYFTTKESGTGLGLATAHRIVTGMAGTIAAVDSSLGGACFEIRLPAVSPQ